jgi:two-component system, NtrC family, sensor kinase
MKTFNSEKTILAIIRFGAVIPTLIFSFLITYTIIKQKDETLNKEIETFKSEFINKEKLHIKNEIDRVVDSINYEIKKSDEDLKAFLKERVYEAHKIASNIYNVESTFLSNKNINRNDHALKTIKYALEGMLYNEGNGYIFIDDINGVKILQPLNKEIEGQSLLEYKDINGYQYMKKVTETIKNKSETYDEYYWYKSKDDKTTYKKISFYKYFEPLNFAIGTGEYYVDFEKKIQNNLLKKIQGLRLDDNSYIFIFNKQGNYLSHFYENKIGTNGFNLKDANGKYFLKDMFEYAEKNKQGYVQYLASSKPGSNLKNVEKISYVRYLDKWDWMIGTGFYLDELNNKINKKEAKLKKEHEIIINNIILLSILLTLILLVISLLISKVIEKKFNNYKKEIKKEINNTIKKERLLVQQSKMAIMGEMIANIAHQWKQPLSVISTVSTGIKIQKELNCLNDEEIVEGMNNINNSAQYLSHTIDDFRNFFKSDKTKINFRFLDIFEDTIKLISPQFTNNNIQFIKNIDNTEIYGYRNELLQVLINIFKNAKDEFIQLDKNQKKFIFVDSYKEDTNYIIKIKDNAGGISPNIIEKIFEPYFTTKEDYEGTGIGLYMCKQIINGMNGEIKVKNSEYEYENQKYKGAEFIISMQLNLE